MIYIHAINDLTPKAAEVEVIKIIRELKRKHGSPITLSEDALDSDLITYFMSDTDKYLMEHAIDLVNPILYELKDLIDNGSDHYSKVNIQRTSAILEDLKSALERNLLYANNMIRYKSQIMRDFTFMINMKLKFKPEEIANHNQKLSDIFEKILRNDGLYFNADGIVNEREINAATGLHKSIQEGYLFHFLLEEEIQKKDFAFVKKRLTSEEVQKSELISTQIGEVKKGINRAYEHNLRMIELALTFYSYIKIIKEDQL